MSERAASGVETTAGPFHAGEEAVQRRLGVHDAIGPWARKVVRPFLPEQHRAFYAQLPFLVAAARDEQGRPWATLLVGPPGFVGSSDPQILEIDAAPPAGDPLEGALSTGDDLGLLGIELATRRRNRVNGRVADSRDGGLRLSVGQSFGNCPQYIREREWRWVEPAELGGQRAPTAQRASELSARAQAWIRAADTFFIATGYRGGAGSSGTDGAGSDERALGMDASHRGGSPGFVRVADAHRLVFPDYAGNDHFNTIGNLVLDPRVGLLFLDWATGSTLQISGRATIDWDSPEVAEHPGARRLVIIDVDEVVILDAAVPLRWDDGAGAVRTLRVVDKRRESEDVVSFELEARDGGPLAPFEAGQHLPIELDIPGAAGPVRRTYSLSNAPGGDRYRISVKREPRGIASRFLHDTLELGGLIAARAPAGEFVLAESERPVVLVSAGIGVTPMVSMLGELVARRDPRRIVFAHVARDGDHHALADEVRRGVDRAADGELHLFYSRPGPDEIRGRDYDHEGRLDAERLAALLGDGGGDGVDVYLCGPVGFMAELRDGLERSGTDPARIHAESFGPRGEAVSSG